MSKLILLVLGAGSGVGLSAASHFEKLGFKVAAVSRRISARDHPTYLTINADLGDPESIQYIFEKVRKDLGEPNVVIYNANSCPRPKQHLLDIPVAEYQKSLQVNTVSAYAAAQQAVQSFSTIRDGGPKAFLFTGNCLNTQIIPRFWTMGAGKSATAHFIEAAGTFYAENGYSFHYVDERTADGKAVYDDIDGLAHAEIFYELTQNKHLQSLVTFVKGKGIVDFDEK